MKGGWFQASALISALVAAVVVGVSARNADAAEAQCTTADTLLDANPARLAEADAAYQAILETTPNSLCAIAGHRASSDLLAAEQLDTTGLGSDASSLITDAIKVRPRTPIPTFLLRGARAARAYTTALALQRGGYHDAAVSILQQALAAYPNYPPSKVMTAQDAAALKDVRPGHRAVWQSETWLSVQDVVIGLFGLFVLALLLGGLLRWLVRQIQGGRFMIRAFETTSGSSSDGKGFAAVVGDYVHRLGSIGGAEGPDRVSKWGDPMTFPTDLTAAVPQIGLINALLSLMNRFIPSRDRTLVGLLHSDQSGTVGVSLTLENRDNYVLGDRPIWSGDFGLTRATAVAPAPPAVGRVPPSDRPELLYPLAYPVAVWAFWKLVHQPEQLGTRDWQSYALFGIGEEFDSLGQFEDAKRSYLEALSLDPQNKPALINLANLLLKGA